MTQIKRTHKAPDFVLTASNGNEVSLTNFRGAPLVLFFYPRDNTVEAVKELCRFRDRFSEFNKIGVRLVGVSIDTLDSHNKFISKHQIPFLLLCDTQMKASRLYGAYQPRKVNGNRVWGLERITFLLDEQGNIVKGFKDVKGAEHVDEVLDFVKKKYMNL